MERRSFLAASAGAAAAAGISGCLSDDREGFDGHPASSDLELAPSLGPGNAEKKVVAFEDPSCPACARFGRDTFPSLKADAEEGRLHWIVRPIGIVQDWGDVAAEAVVGVDDHGGDAFSLFQRFYTGQTAVSSANIFDRLREWIDEQGLDGSEVLKDVEYGDYDGVVSENLRDARSAGLTSTPTFYLFSDGEFVTEIAGPQGYGVFQSALDL